MYRHPDSHLCYKDSVHKDWVIEVVGEDPIGNDILMQDEITLTDPLCSKDDITLGACESATLEFKIRNLTNRTFKDKKLSVSIILDNHTSTPIPMGVFIVEEDELEDDQRVRKIKAHDLLYEINNKDFAPWFNNQQYPLTLEQFRNSFFLYAEVEQETTSLINDQIPLQFTVTNSGATKRMIEEEKEKIKQEYEKLELGIPVTKYVLIDPETYDDWPIRYETSYPEEYKWIPTYSPVTPTTGANPHASGWFERYKDYYVLTEDTEVKESKTYYIRSAVPQINPNDEGWYDIQKSDYKPTPDTSPEENKQYYVSLDTPVQSPKEYGWYDIQLGEYGETEDEEIIPGKSYYTKETIDRIKPTYKEAEIIDAGTNQNPSELNWYEYNSINDDYYKSTDTRVVQGKVYFELVAPENDNTAFLDITPWIDAHRTDNPSEEGWYEFVNQAYVKTEDTQIDRTKHYYINIWEINQNEEKDTVEDQILGSEIIQAICEINGCFGHMGRDGKFHYIKLKPIDFNDEGLYPEPELYPDPTLYPQGQPYDELLDRSKYESVVKKDYYVKKIDRLVICKEDGDAGYVYPEGSIPDDHNTYKIVGNFIWYSFTGDKATLDIVGQNLLTQGIAQVSEYTPCEIDMMGNPCLELGDTLKVQTRLGTFYTYVLNRTLSNSQRLVDKIEAKGSKERDVENSLYDAVIELKGRSNILTRNVNETRSEIISVSEGLTSLIKQTAESITLSVSKEIKNVEDKTNEKYEASTKYTDSKILDTVSRTVFDENLNEISKNFSEFERTADMIQATVEKKVSQTGTGEGFRWTLLSNGFTLESKGGYVDVTTSLTEESNPKALGLYEIDTENHTMKETDDEEVLPNKSYFEAVGPNDYEVVFRVNSGGVYVKDAITTKYLDVRNVATIHRVEADEADILSLTTRAATIEGDLTATKARITTLETTTLKAGEINAGNITSGTMSADRISASTLKTKIINTLDIIASTASPNQGTICIGTVKYADMYKFDGSDYRRITTKAVKDIGGNTIQVLCLS